LGLTYQDASLDTCKSHSQANRLAFILCKPYSLPMSKIAAVLTGDLIASTKVGQDAVDGAMAVLEGIANHEAQISGLDIRFARFRGDGWQMYCPSFTKAFRLTMLVLANLHSRPALVQTRLAVATGPVKTIPTIGLASAGGEVFSLSGRELDSMKTERLAFFSQVPDAKWQKPLFSYLDWQSSRWSPQQAEAVALAFHQNPARPRDVASALGISRQAAQARLSGAGYEPLLDADIAFHAIIWPQE
jgi:hypothetical protein